MPDPGEVFEAIVRLGRSTAEVPLDSLADEAGSIPGESLACLIEDGSIEVVGRPDGAAFACLTPLAAARLGLALNRDSSRWVDEQARVRPIKRKSRTIAETDLRDECENPLDRVPDPKAREAQDDALMRERMDEAAARLGARRLRRLAAAMTPPTVLLMGVRAWPLAGQDRGPFAPEVAAPGKPAPCPACGGPARPLRESEGCLACSRWWSDPHAPKGMLDGARAEVHRAWKERKGEFLDVSAPTDAEKAAQAKVKAREEDRPRSAIEESRAAFLAGSSVDLNPKGT